MLKFIIILSFLFAFRTITDPYLKNLKHLIIPITYIVLTTIIFLIPQAFSETQYYPSFCNSQKACEHREYNFIKSNHRLPVTDIELIQTYKISEHQLFTEPEQKPIYKIIPMNVYCEDCRIVGD